MDVFVESLSIVIFLKKENMFLSYALPLLTLVIKTLQAAIKPLNFFFFFFINKKHQTFFIMRLKYFYNEFIIHNGTLSSKTEKSSFQFFFLSYTVYLCTFCCFSKIPTSEVELIHPFNEGHIEELRTFFNILECMSFSGQSFLGAEYF